MSTVFFLFMHSETLFFSKRDILVYWQTFEINIFNTIYIQYYHIIKFYIFIFFNKIGIEFAINSLIIFTSLICLYIFYLYLWIHHLMVYSSKFYNNRYMIFLTQIANTEIFAFIAPPVFSLLRRKVLFVNKKDNRNH